MDQVARLRADFLARQAKAMARARAREARQRRSGAVAGAFAGLVAVALTAVVTRRSFAWHSFLLEGILCGVAGYVLARFHGGLLKGVALLPGAYFMAWFLRASGLDPAVLFPAPDVRGALAAQGHLMTLGLLVATGGLMGHIIEDSGIGGLGAQDQGGAPGDATAPVLAARRALDAREPAQVDPGRRSA
jgi:hypothetical protein